MTTTRIGHGLAISPEKDLAMFAEMARKGKHLNGLSRNLHGFTFADGAPEDLNFEMAHEDDPDEGYFDIFAAAGWTHVLSMGDVHIFKAVPGTPPLHSMVESRREELTGQRDQFARLGLVAILVLVAVGLLIRAVHWSAWVEVPLLWLAVVGVVYTTFPLVGYLNQLRKL